MPDPDRPDTDRFGDPSKEVDEGALLFDPSGPPDRDDDDFFDAESPGKSRAGFWGAAGLAVILVGLFLLQFTGGQETETPQQEVVPLVPEVPADTTSRAALIPLPTDSVAGPIESSVRIAVRALGDGGNALGDTLVRFSIETGGGTLQSEEVQTTAEGIAVNFVRLPSRPGRTAVVASIPDSPPHEASLTAVALPGAPARISMVSGNDQEAEVGGLVPDRLYVGVVDGRGNPVPGAVVTFRIGSGEGQMAPAQTRADSLGQASAIWRLGMVEGEQTLVASVSSLDQQVTFRATATPAQTLEVDSRGRAETEPVTVLRKGFAVGVGHACVLEGGNLRCRGADDRGQSSPTGTLDFVAVVAGSSHTCALSSTGVASCWGANDQGQLGDGTRNDRSTPTRVRTDLRFSTLTTGEKHTCGLAGGGVPLCWGENLSGQVGDGTRNDQMVPRTVGEGLGFTEITAGSSHTCGRTASGNTFCWGANNRGQLGDGSSGLDSMTPTLLQSTVSGLVAGHEHSCGIASGQAHCWGANTFGQLGDGTTDDRSAPTPVQGLPGRPTQLAAGTVHTCARLVDGRVFCWGQNFSGQVGDGTTQNRASPVEVAGGLQFSEIYAGGAQTCGVTTDGAQYCWGLNQSGQLGDGTRVNRSTPTRVGG